MKLARLAVADLRELIRKDPDRRAAAWAELTYRNRFRRQVERENGQFKPWNPPNLTPIDLGMHEVDSGVSGVIAFEGIPSKPKTFKHITRIMVDDPAGELPGPLGD